MKILNRPITGEHKFVCEFCRTKFVADENEYKVSSYDKGIGQYNRKVGFLHWKTMISYQPTWILECDCPACGRTAEVEFPTGEEVYEREYISPDF